MSKPIRIELFVLLKLVAVKKLFNYSLAFLLVLCTSCIHHTENESEDINLLSVNITDEPINLSSLYDKAKFVPLENGENSMISYAKKMMVKDRNVFLYDSEPYPSIKVFSSNGKYVRRIGNLGHGKGEYVDIDDFTMSLTGDSVFILCNNRVLVYDEEGIFLFKKDINLPGIIRRIECCNGGYVCLTEYKGNDYLLHFLDNDFDIKKELIPSEGKIIREPSLVINPIQVHGKDVWYYNWFNSTFYVIDTQDNYKTSSYQIKTEKANKLEQYEVDDYAFSNDFDAVSCYKVVDNMVFGRFHVAQYADRPFFWDLGSNEIRVTSEHEWIPYIEAISSDTYYSLVDQDTFIHMSKNMEKLDYFNSNYFDVYNSPITEKDNCILIEFSPRETLYQ